MGNIKASESTANLPTLDQLKEWGWLHAPCKCGHLMVKHLHIDVGGDGKEYDRCTLCPCRMYRADPDG